MYIVFLLEHLILHRRLPFFNGKLTWNECFLVIFLTACGKVCECLLA